MLHFVNQRPLQGPYPENTDQVWFGMGCFWGAERLFWETKGVWVTSVGYGAGHSLNPDYKQVCSGNSGHAELVHIVFEPDILPFNELLKIFFENHDPSQGNRQGNDIGSQYRSVIGTFSGAQSRAANMAREKYDKAYKKSGKNNITTEIINRPKYYLAEEYHQQYLAKNPSGYCGLKGTGISCNI